MAITLPPPPSTNDLKAAAWQDWFYKVSVALRSVSDAVDRLSTKGGVPVSIGIGTGSPDALEEDCSLFIQGMPGKQGERGEVGPVGFGIDGEDAGDWLAPPANTPPPPNTSGLEIRQEITGVLSGGLLSATSGSTTFSISDGTGQIVDSYTNQLAPSIKNISWTGLTGITDSYLTSEVTYITINSTGAVQQSTSIPTNDTMRPQIILGFLVHSNGTIQTCVPAPVLAYENGFLAQDLLGALGTITNGCVYSGGTGLTLARSSGRLMGRGRHYSVDAVTPNEAILNAANPVSIVTHCRNGSNTVFSASPAGTTLVVNRYDDGTAASAGVPNGVVSTNSWQAMRLHLSSTGAAVVQYGQTLYNSLANAIAGVSTEVFYQDPLLAATAFRGYMFVRGGATNLSNSSDATFQTAGKLGDTVAGGGGTSTGLTGPPGPMGFGIDGQDGEDGISVQGPRGFSGVQGTPGVSVVIEGEQGEDGFPIPGPPGPSGNADSWVLAFAAAHG